MRTEINYDLINELYYAWLNERDPFVQRKRKDDIQNRFSPYEFLIYSSKNSYMPFKAFRNIFPLSDLLTTLEKMQRQGKDVRNLTNQLLLIETLEDVKSVSEFAKKGNSSSINDLCLVFTGSNVFTCGDFKNIGKKFPNTHANNLSIEQVEQLAKTQNDYRGIPITITIDNAGQLSLERLSHIEKVFDIDGIKIQEKEKIGHANQGESTPLNLRTYKQIRTVIDDILTKLYIDESSDKMHIDYQLSTQIIDILARKIEKDYDAENKPRSSTEVKNASGMVGLLTGKSMCMGYSEILRNVLSCVNIECTRIDGTDMKGDDHTWNQVKLGDLWFNVDLTFARDKICEGEPSGDLFMSDMAFFGERKRYTFEKGKEVNGKKVESTVMIGGHSPHVYGSNHKQCGGYITPYLTSTLIERSRLYDENYKREGKYENYKGPIPYVGSSIEKTRSTSRDIATFQH